ncbi:TonB-dependent receptor [Imhoffiella purpurea]|uniref:Ferric vibriobactin receptor ViuA n=1 Tax=Imhoffiella purpurea TaxID=1249627 RepID=W9VB02_9GAMM|nr:TonB-dependent receptor [Imhoffiella purpurea]EXJ14116.1 Ferric vibriobactin receptor ViuA [Imhoffiella purpurea]
MDNSHLPADRVRLQPRRLLTGLTLASLGLTLGQAAAQGDETRSNAVLSEIVVTGEKSERSIEDTGSSVEVFDAARIESIPNATEVRDLLRVTPNVVDTGIGNNLPTIRGIDGSGPTRGASAFLAGSRPRLNMSADGRSFTYNEVAFGLRSLWDIDQVEVFRGPQSHIQGRNAIGGAIVLNSKDPTFHWEAAAKGAVGEQSSSQTAAMLSGPILDNELAFRVSVDRQKRTSFVDYISYEPVDNPRRIEASTARAKLLYEPSALPGLSSMVTLNYLETRAPQNETLIPPAGQESARFDPRKPVFSTRSTSGIWDLSWDASSALSFENQLIYTEFSNHRLAALDLPYADIEGDEIQAEPLVRFRSDDERIRGLAGLRFFHSHQDEFVNIFGGSTFEDETQTTSAFAELTYALRPDLNLTVAGRYEQEHRERTGGSSRAAIDFDETYSAFLPKLDLAWKPLAGTTVGATVGRGYNAGGAGVTFGSPVVSYTFDPEYVWSYELYSRHRLQDGRLELTSNLFFNDYQDMQLPYYLGTNSTVIRNADTVHTYGAELGARWLPLSGLELTGALGLLKTDIESFSESGIAGNELPRSPSLTANLGATYAFGQGFEIGGDLQFTDTYYSGYDNDLDGEIPSHWLANLQLAYNFDGGRVSLYARNIFDSDDWVMVVDNDTSSPIVQQPRLVGASVELYF